MVPVSTTLNSADLKVLVPEWGVFLPGATASIILNWKLRLPSCHFGLQIPINKQTNKGIIPLGVLIYLDYDGEIGLPPQWREEELYLECRRSFMVSLDATMSSD